MAAAITVVAILIGLLAVLALGPPPGCRLLLKRIQSWSAGTSRMASMRGHARVVLNCVDGSTELFLLQGERMTLGRSHVNDISRRQDRSLSRRHLVFENDGEDWTVRDLGSSNGTFVNGVRIAGPRLLRPGDRIMAGHTVIAYDEPSQTTTGDSASLEDAEQRVPRQAEVPVAPSHEG